MMSTMTRPLIIRENPLTVLRAYNSERDPRKKAAIYARDLSKRITDGEDLPVHAANTLGTLAGEIVTQRTLELLAIELPLLSRLGTDFSDQGANFNQTVIAHIATVPTSSPYHPVNGYATEATVTIDVPVLIDEHQSVQVAFNANELASTSRKLFDELAPAMAHRVGLDLISKAYGIITAANFPAVAAPGIVSPTVEALIDFDRETVIEMGGALSDRGVPTMGRTLLLNGSYHDKLFSDQTVALLAATQRADLITGSKMIDLHDFGIVRASNLPAANNLVGFGFSKSALVLSTRVPNDYASLVPEAIGGGTVRIITEPQTGLSVMLVHYVDHQLGLAARRFAYMYGAAKGQVLAGQRLVSG